MSLRVEFYERNVFMKCTTDEKSMEAFFEVVVESDSF